MKVFGINCDTTSLCFLFYAIVTQLNNNPPNTIVQQFILFFLYIKINMKKLLFNYKLRTALTFDGMKFLSTDKNFFHHNVEGYLTFFVFNHCTSCVSVCVSMNVAYLQNNKS